MTGPNIGSYSSNIKSVYELFETVASGLRENRILEFPLVYATEGSTAKNRVLETALRQE